MGAARGFKSGKGRLIEVLLILWAGILGLSGCAEVQQEALPQEIGSFGVDGYYYEAEELTVEGFSENCLFAPVISGEKVCFARDNRTDSTQPNEYTIICYDIKQMTYEEFPVADPDFYWFRVMEADAEGNLYLVLEKYGKKITPGSGVNYFEYELRKLDPHGKELYRKDVTAFLTPLIGTGILNTMMIDGKGRWYLILKDCLALFDEKGEYSGIIEKSKYLTGAMGRGSDGRIYHKISRMQEGEMQEELYTVDFEDRSLNKVCGGFLGTASKILEMPESTAKVGVFEAYGLYEFDIQKQELTRLLKWSDSGLEGKWINRLAFLKDGRILLTCFGAGGSGKRVLVLTKKAIEDPLEKQQLVIGALYSNPKMETAVINFNRSSEEYQVIIRDYSGGEAISREDAWIRLSSEIAAGQAPDLLVLNQLPEPEAYFKKGMFLDLTPYLESSTLLKKENYPQQILSMYAFEGGIMGIPESFSLQTLMGKEELLGDRIGWTVEDMMDFAGEHKAVRLIGKNTKEDILNCCLAFSYETFVAKEGTECRFRSPEFIKILEFAASFPENGDAPADTGRLTEQLRDGELLLMDASFSGIQGYVYNSLLFGGEQVTCIGFPAPEGTIGCWITPCNEVYGILASSQHSQGAWEFIEAWLAGALTLADSTSGFPSDRQKLEQELNKGLDEDYMTGQGLRAVSHKELEALKSLIEQAQCFRSHDRAVAEIIQEETADYLSSIRTSQETAEHIQSRVELYLQEKE